MAILPSYTVLADSMLTPAQVSDKFQSRSLAGIHGIGMGGLGCGCNWVDDLGQCMDPEPCGSSAPAGSTTTAPNGSVTNWTPVLTATTQGLIDLAKLNLIQPGTVQQGGATIRQNPGYAVPVPAVNQQLGLNANTGGSLLIVAAIAGVALLMMSKRN